MSERFRRSARQGIVVARGRRAAPATCPRTAPTRAAEAIATRARPSRCRATNTLQAIARAAGGLSPLPALAHERGAVVSASPSTGVEPWLVALLVVTIVLYGIGLRRLWRTSGYGRGIGAGAAVAFVLGWLALCGALLPPLDALAAIAFRYHMLQHELLMIVAAPLLVAGRPLAVWSWALPRPAVAGLGSAFRRRAFDRPWRAITSPLGAWMLHAAALWIWHVPALFGAALADRGLHEWQHASFVASALLFWWSVLGRYRRAPGVALASLFTTMLSTGALGALLTFSSVVLYGAYRLPAGSLTPLEDQQIGGLIMWLPGGLVYVGIALAVAAGALAAGPNAEVVREAGRQPIGS